MNDKFVLTRRDCMTFDSAETADNDQVNLDTLAASAFADHSIVPFRQQGELRYFTGLNEIRYATFVHRLLTAIPDDSVPMFQINSLARKPGLCKIASSNFVKCLDRVYGHDLLLMREEFPMHELSPVLNFIWRTRRRVMPLLVALEQTHSVDHAQKWIEIGKREVAKFRLLAPCLLARWKHFKRPTRKNFANMVNAMNSACESRQCVTSCRIDVYIEKDMRSFRSSRPNVGKADFLAICSARRRFVRHIENRFKIGFLVMFTKIEYGRDRLFHMHCHILLDGQRYKNPSELVDELGKKWEEITGATRSFTNVHTLTRKLKYNALGVVNLHDHHVRVGLIKIVSYFTLADVFVKLRLEGRQVKTFSIIGTNDEKKRLGRPPKRAAPTLTMTYKDAVSTISFM